MGVDNEETLTVKLTEMDRVRIMNALMKCAKDLMVKGDIVSVRRSELLKATWWKLIHAEPIPQNHTTTQ